MPITTDEDAKFVADMIRNGTLQGERKNAAFAELEAFRARPPANRTPEQSQARIAELDAERAALDEGSFIKDVVGQTAIDSLGAPEAIAEFLSGGAATAAGGAAAIPVTAFDAAKSLITGEESDSAGAGRAVIERFQEAGTFKPRTEVGQRASEAIQAPLEAAEQFADKAGEVTGDPDDVLGATLVKTAILGAPALFGLRRGTVTNKPAPKTTPRQDVAATAAKEGYVTPPSVRGEAGLKGAAEGAGGKIKTGQQAIEVNQAVTNKLANRAVGLPPEVPLSVEILQGIRAEAGKAYEAIRGTGEIITDTIFRKDLSAATSKFRSAARDFPELAKNEVTGLVDTLRVAKFDAGAGVDAIALLRNKADVAFKSGDSALGGSYKSAANAIEGVMERHLGRGGDAAMLDAFRNARQQIAETYTVQDALQARVTGEISAPRLAAQLKKGTPLTGDLRAIADFANTFPSVSRLFTGKPQIFSPVDVGVAALGSTAGLGALSLGGGPLALAPLLLGAARPLLRKGALSTPKPPSSTTTPSSSALSGVAGSSGFARDQ